MARSADPETDLREELAGAHAALEEARDALADAGEERVRQVADVYDEFTDLLARYEDSATGTGREEFQNYVEFEGELARFEESLDEDLPEREAFEEACERLDRRRLDERDFQRARDDLEPVRELVDLLSNREAARRRLREARDDVEARIREIDDRLDDLESIHAFADADFDADVDVLQDPIETYDRDVGNAFVEFRREESARSVLDFVTTTEAYPLVPYRSPPEELREYLDEHEVGAETITTLLEYADYSRSKLSHYVDDPAAFRGAIATNRTYLERLDAEPLRIDWPPPQFEALRWRIEELIAVTGRFASEDVTEELRAVRDRARAVEYDRLREAARAREVLSERERERLRSGEIEREMADLREERADLRAALEEYEG